MGKMVKRFWSLFLPLPLSSQLHHRANYDQSLIEFEPLLGFVDCGQNWKANFVPNSEHALLLGKSTQYKSIISIFVKNIITICRLRKYYLCKNRKKEWCQVGWALS